MTIMQQIGRVSSSVDAANRAGEFVMLAKCLSVGRGNFADATDVAKAAHATPRVLGILQKAAVPTADASTTGWAAELADYRWRAAGFIDTLQGFSAFDRIYADGSFVRVPLRTRIAIGTTAATAAGISALAAAPIGSMTFAGCTLEPVMVRGDIVVSDELAAYSSAAAMARLGDEPRMAVGKATDKEFIDLITAETGISSASSTGLDATQIVSDLQDALGAVDVGIASKLYIVLPGAVAKTLALIRDAGGWLFPELTPSDGSIQAFRPSSPTRLTTRSLY